MPWKMNESGAPVLTDGKILAVVNGKEVSIDPDQVLGKIEELTKEAATHRQNYDKATERLKPWESLQVDGKPIEPETVAEAVTTFRNLKAGDLVTANRVQELQEQALKPVRQENEDLKARLTKSETALVEKEKLFTFKASKFVSDCLYDADTMYLKYGAAFKLEEGQLVAYRADGSKIRSATNHGSAASFEEAIQILVDEDAAARDRILPNRAGSGSGASNGMGGGAGGKVMTKQAFDALSPHAQMKFMKDGGQVND